MSLQSPEPPQLPMLSPSASPLRLQKHSRARAAKLLRGNITAVHEVELQPSGACIRAGRKAANSCSSFLRRTCFRQLDRCFISSIEEPPDACLATLLQTAEFHSVSSYQKSYLRNKLSPPTPQLGLPQKLQRAPMRLSWMSVRVTVFFFFRILFLLGRLLGCNGSKIGIMQTTSRATNCNDGPSATLFKCRFRWLHLVPFL